MNKHSKSRSRSPSIFATAGSKSASFGRLFSIALGAQALETAYSTSEPQALAVGQTIVDLSIERTTIDSSTKLERSVDKDKGIGGRHLWFLDAAWNKG